MFQPIDPLLHAELRLAVMSLLISADEAEFPYIKEQTGATAGNLSVQIDKLSTAGYIEIGKPSRAKGLAPSAGLPKKEDWLSNNMLKP